MKFFKPYLSPFVTAVLMATLLCGTISCKKAGPNGGGAVYIPVDTARPLKSYLALGDSYTIGSSVTAPERFPNQAAQLLAQQGLQFKLPDIVAASGWTTDYLLSTLASTSLQSNYDLVTLLIGVNNQYQRRSQAEYRIQFTELLNKSIAYAGGRKSRVFVLSIPDYSVTPFAQYSDTARIAREIDEFNAINKQITLSMGVAYLDITPISREARADPMLIAADGLHPSGKQYSRWVALLVAMIKAVF